MCDNEEPTCVFCKSPLLEGATLCLQCKSFQGRWRRLFSSLDIKSLVALVPIVTLAFAFLQDRFKSHGSDIQVTVLHCETDKIHLMASNIGDRTGVVKSVRARLVVNGKRSQDVTTLKGSDQFEVVTPDEPSFLELVPVEGSAVASLPTHPPNVKQCDYEMDIQIVEFQRVTDEPKFVTTSCHCPR